MESSILSLTYKGNISEAITEARQQKKLFLVYISGDDENSITLEQTTWLDLSVRDVISKKCVFLHLINGTVDASNFSAIFPLKTVPIISAVGNNGAMLWNHGGYINAGELVESIGKAWEALHFQETALTLLTAALASKKLEPSSSGPANVTSEVKSSSSTDNPSPSIGNEFQDSEDETSISDLVGGNDCERKSETNEAKPELSSCQPLDIAAHELSNCSSPINPLSSEGNLHEYSKDRKLNSELAGDRDYECRSDAYKKNDMHADEESSKSNLVNDVSDKNLKPSPISETHKGDMLPVTAKAARSSSHLDLSTAGEIISLSNSGNECTKINKTSSGISEKIADKLIEKNQDNKVDDSRAHPDIMKLTDVLLNIRLLDGSCLQAKFSYTDTLGLVKKYVNENKKNSFGAYDLAVPYPRRIFNDQDMEKALSELGFTHREALVVIPRRHATVFKHGQQSSHDSSEGYFGYLKSIISYFNPFSYMGGEGGASSSSTSEPVGNDNLQQHNREASFKTNKQQSSSSLKSNIHTLTDIRDDDDTDRDRNLFWNGNSTQFGGDDKKK